MRRSVFTGFMFILVLPCFVWAGDIDGVWMCSECENDGAVMMRENGGTVVAIAADLDSFGERYDYCVLMGPQAGDTISLEDYDYVCGVSIKLTITLTSPTTATVKVNHCQPAFAYSCTFPSGVSFNMEKVF